MIASVTVQLICLWEKAQERQLRCPGGADSSSRCIPTDSTNCTPLSGLRVRLSSSSSFVSGGLPWTKPSNDHYAILAKHGNANEIDQYNLQLVYSDFIRRSVIRFKTLMTKKGEGASINSIVSVHIGARTFENFKVIRKYPVGSSGCYNNSRVPRVTLLNRRYLQ